MSKEKVLIGMSGGVDSSVSALLLKNMGYDVIGVTMKLQPDRFSHNNPSGGCCSLDDIDDARRICYKIGIEHIVMNFTEIFTSEVIEYFVSEYKIGRTPNPCIACNSQVKFRALLDRALALGFNYIATGHYAVTKYDDKLKRFLLYKSRSTKDQSYVLYNMTQHQLKHTLFPLANMEKSEVRKIAHENNLIVADKPDSQEICFIPDGNHVSFIEKFTGKKSVEGDFVDQNGTILGKHKGIMNYTVGQRKGLGIALGKPMYVTKIDCVNNTVELGEEGAQYSKTAIVEKTNFIPFDSLESEMIVDAKIRYQSKPSEARIFSDKSQIFVKFKNPQRAIAPGQSIVFYKGDLVVGGGIIK